MDFLLNQLLSSTAELPPAVQQALQARLPYMSPEQKQQLSRLLMSGMGTALAAYVGQLLLGPAAMLPAGALGAYAGYQYGAGRLNSYDPAAYLSV